MAWVVYEGGTDVVERLGYVCERGVPVEVDDKLVGDMLADPDFKKSKKGA